MISYGLNRKKKSGMKYLQKPKSVIYLVFILHGFYKLSYTGKDINDRIKLAFCFAYCFSTENEDSWLEWLTENVAWRINDDKQV